ncbi:MAG: hypothetical protein ACYC99_12435 [Candidatus Geothermincolia bacterium]
MRRENKTGRHRRNPKRRVADRMLLSLFVALLLLVPLTGSLAYGASAGAAPTVISMTPNSGAQGTTLNVTDLRGTNFNGTPAVWLQKAGQGSVTATNVILASSEKLDCSFALPLGAATGAWDLYVKNPDGQAASLTGAFTMQAGSALTWFFAEGSTRPGFDSYFTIQNPGGALAEVTVTYLTGVGTTKNQKIKVPAASRATVHPADILGSANDSAHDFSTVITCGNGQQIVAERPMYFNYTGPGTYNWNGGSDVLGATATSKAWYFAEGTCRPGFDTYMCLLNPFNARATVKLTYMKGDGTSVTDQVTVNPYSRSTVVPRSKLGTGNDAAHDFSTAITSDQPVIAERPMYFNYNGAWTGGHDVVGATSESSVFYFAEGTTRPGFDPYFCVQNPGTVAATVTLRYMKGDGTNTSEQVAVSPNSRSTVVPRNKLGTGDDPAHDFSTEVTSDQPVIVERPMYFNYQGVWTGGSDVMGATFPSSTFYFAEGTSRPGFVPYFTIQNSGSAAANVALTYMTGDGRAVQDSMTVAPNARSTVAPINKLGSGNDAAHDFSTMITSDQPVIAERPMYFDYRGWTGGSCVVGYGPYCQIGGSLMLEGIPLPAYSGLVGREQHLCLTMSQEPPETHYAVSNTPEAARNGMAWQEGGGSGYGAWGKAAPLDDERYYINMRWNYTDMHGQEVLAGKDWYYRKRVLVINPANNTRVIASIIEYGPATWTGRVSGLSPEAMLVLGADTDDNLTYYWALDQSLPPGPI